MDDRDLYKAEAYKERSKIYKLRGELEKAYQDYAKMPERGDSRLGPDFIVTHQYEIREDEI
ncbi:hypothetical protein AGMMS49991_11920 [Spirochaetia bacterium]|nr:hypothetical protein AGMMS49991_11920 [Spirochaetia bacterium]